MHLAWMLIGACSIMQACPGTPFAFQNLNQTTLYCLRGINSRTCLICSGAFMAIIVETCSGKEVEVRGLE